METILHLLPLTEEQQAAFRAAAPEAEHLFLPTQDRRGATDIPRDWRDRTTILLGFVPPADLKSFPRLKWVQSWNAGVDLTLDDSGPQILLVHTHGSEAYAPEGEDVYTPSDGNSRTLDENYNVVRVGDEMAEVFREMGLTVLHDRTLYDYPQYNGAYSRSGEAVASYLAEYPSIRIVLDIHRDALVGSDGTVYKAVTTVDGEKTAQVMLVLGSGSGHPDWQANLSLALRVQKSLDSLYPTLARPITLRGSVYNQELSPGSLLVEVGTHGNTLREALRAARCFARAAGQVFLSLK